MKILVKLLDKMFRKSEEKEATLYYNSFKYLSMRQIDKIIDVINEEIEISEKKFGLVLREDDKIKEKVVIITLYNKTGQVLMTIGKELSFNDYGAHVSICTNRLLELMNEETKYHFDNTPEGEVKNKYNCHLEAIAVRLTKDFLNDDIPA